MGDNYYNTKTILIGDHFLDKNYYCLYCSKKAIEKIRVGSYTKDEDNVYFYHCDCEDALKEREIQLKKLKVEQETREDLFKLKLKVSGNEKNINKLKYKYELEQLKRKHKIK